MDYMSTWYITDVIYINCQLSMKSHYNYNNYIILVWCLLSWLKTISKAVAFTSKKIRSALHCEMTHWCHMKWWKTSTSDLKLDLFVLARHNCVMAGTVSWGHVLLSGRDVQSVSPRGLGRLKYETWLSAGPNPPDIQVTWGNLVTPAVWFLPAGFSVRAWLVMPVGGSCRV